MIVVLLETGTLTTLKLSYQVDPLISNVNEPEFIYGEKKLKKERNYMIFFSFFQSVIFPLFLRKKLSITNTVILS